MVEHRKGRTRRGLGVGAVAFVVVLAAGACGSYDNGGSTGRSTEAPKASWTDVLSAANSEGQVEVWSALNPAHNAAVETAFEKANPKIDLTIAAYAPSDITTRVDAEQQAGVGTVDVVLNTDRIWHSNHLTDGYFQTITGPDVAAANDSALNGSQPSDDGTPKATQLLYDGNTRLITSFAAWGYAWNTDAVAGEPTFESLFSTDTFKGRLGINDPTSNTVVTVLYGKLNERYPGLFDRLGELNPTLYALSGPASEALGAGAVDAVLAISGAATAPVKKAGFAFDTKFPALATPLYGEVLASSDSPNAAQVFTNWLSTADGQTAWADGYTSILPNIPTSLTPSAGIEVFEAETADPKQITTWRDELNDVLGR